MAAKKPIKKSSPKKIAPPTALFGALPTLQGTRGLVADLAAQLDKRIAECVPGKGHMTQSDLQLAALMDALSSLTDGVMKRFKDRALSLYALHKEQNAELAESSAAEGVPYAPLPLPFEQGEIIIAFVPNNKRTPKWKEEAIREARDLAKVLGHTFNAEVYEETVLSKYPPSDKPSVKLVWKE